MPSRPPVAIAEQAHEQIKAKILSLDFEKMEHLVAALLRAMGYITRVSPRGRDRGIDVEASRDGAGLQRIRVQVKHHPNEKIGGPDMRNFLGALRPGDRGLYVSTGGFSKDAIYEAERATITVTLYDLDELTLRVVDHYEKFDDKGRTLLPLLKVHWPI